MAIKLNHKGLLMDLVELRKNEIYYDSNLVARKFGKKHAEVVRIIKSLQDELSELRVISNHPKIITEEREYRGTKYTAYLMSREYFSLLVMRFKGKRALEWQLKFNDAFYMMERRLLQVEKNDNDVKWIGTRQQTKISRREETDVIKEFVEYSYAQGNTKAHFYYATITKATYKALGLMYHKDPKLRDTLNIYELAQIMLAEQVAKNSIKKYMDLGRYYIDIYQSVKSDLINFSNSMRLEGK